MSLGYIKQLEQEAGTRAKGLGLAPRQFKGDASDLEEVEEFVRSLPNLGDYRPSGWKEVDDFMADSSGFGAPDEPADTLDQFVKRVIEDDGEHGYAIISVGQFQVVIGVFEKESALP